MCICQMKRAEIYKLTNKYTLNKILNIFYSELHKIVRSQSTLLYIDFTKMEDDQLQMLQRQLMAVQQQKTNPLSERTVAQIMVKLHHEGFKFYPTTDGNQYLTPERLDAEIIAIIRERGHIKIGIIPQILNIGLDVIQSRIIKITTQYSYVIRHNTVLVSDIYLKNVTQKIRQSLELQGIVDLQTVALQNQFNMVFTQRLVRQNLDELKAQLVGNQLITNQYTLMKKSRILGFLSVINSPISLQSLVKNSQVQDRNIQTIITELISQKKLKGKYQNSYFVPQSFQNDQKQTIVQFFNNNGYIELDMLKKKYLVSKPQQWIDKNLTQKHIIFQNVCYQPQKLESYANQVNQLIKTQGFIELSTVIPFQIKQKSMESFLSSYCHLQEFFLCEGYCYSAQWLQKCTLEFKQRVFKSIFFDKKQAKGKKGKKQKSNEITQQQLVETLFNSGLADYSVAQNLAPVLLPILQQKLQDLKKKYQKDLSQNKGFLNNSFLKYKTCKTIIRNLDGLNRMMNIIQKQKKKSKQWKDPDFGPCQSDSTGQYSVIYYDGALPKFWPNLQALKWERHIAKPSRQAQTGLMSQSLFGQILSLIQQHNGIFCKQKIESPIFMQLKEEQQSPFAFQFYQKQNDKRYVIVDEFVPFVEEKLIGLSGIYGLAQKAYAKFRYCYKGILNLGIKTILLEMTGKATINLAFQNLKEGEVIQQLKGFLQENRLIIVIGQGEANKNLFYKEQQTQFKATRPYVIRMSEKWEYVQISNSLQSFCRKIDLEHLAKIFKNAYVV